MECKSSGAQADTVTSRVATKAVLVRNAGYHHLRLPDLDCRLRVGLLFFVIFMTSTPSRAGRELNCQCRVELELERATDYQWNFHVAKTGRSFNLNLKSASAGGLSYAVSS